MNDNNIEFPLTFRVRQKLDAPEIQDIPRQVETQLSQLSLDQKIKPGQSVAITAGSRGIANIHLIIKAIVDHVKHLGADPFIVPAMGSHAGGAAEGQRRIVESYGITEQFCQCPIRSTMETVIVCQADEGFPIHFDKHAYAADHVIVCNRIKTHTQFTGDIESGLSKMLLIGLGKHAGAKIYHRAIKDYSFAQILSRVRDEVLTKCAIAAGVAIVENGYGRTAGIKAVHPRQFADAEKELLAQAKQWAPRLPFDQADILLIDQIGKDISGTGFDLSCVGRKYLDHRPAPDEHPKIKMIALRDLTEKSQGNAEGIGLAEFCLTRMLDRMDINITRINALTSGHYTGAMLPLDYPTDHRMLQDMLGQIGLTEPPDAKLLWIPSTTSLTEVECSRAYLDQARTRDDLQILTDPRPLPFDPNGNLPDDHMITNKK